jgi:hypothetical protein
MLRDAAPVIVAAPCQAADTASSPTSSSVAARFCIAGRTTSSSIWSSPGESLGTVTRPPPYAMSPCGCLRPELNRELATHGVDSGRRDLEDPMLQSRIGLSPLSPPNIGSRPNPAQRRGKARQDWNRVGSS